MKANYERRKIKSYKFQDSLFRFEWMVFLGGERNKAIEIFANGLSVPPWLGPINHQAEASFMAHNDFKCGLFWFRYPQPKPAIIAHEAVHAAMFALNKLQIAAIDTKNEELVAYYVQWLVEKIGQA